MEVVARETGYLSCPTPEENPMSTNDFDNTSSAADDAVETTALPETETENIAELDEPAGKRFTKRSWITLAAAAGALVVAAAIAVPLISTNIARGQAIDALTTSEAELTDAHKSLVKATDELSGAADGAVVVYTESGEFVKVVRAALLADPATLENLNGARTELVEIAALTLEGEVATAPVKTEVPKLTTQDTPTTMEAMEEQTEANDKLTAMLTKDAKKLRDTVTDIEEKGESIAELTETVVTSGAEFGAAVTGMEKADAATVEGLAAAVAALADTETPAINRVSTYVGAYDAVKGSHDAVVAAEKAAAEEAARQEQARQNGGSSNNNGGSSGNRGGSSNNNGGSSNNNGGSSNNGGGSPNNGGGTPNNGGGTPNNGGGTPGNGGGTPNRTPANFERGSGYVGYNGGSCSYYSSHQVGWGGTSTGGRSLGSQGLTWSATVNGDTVTYYLCGW